MVSRNVQRLSGAPPGPDTGHLLRPERSRTLDRSDATTRQFWHWLRARVCPVRTVRTSGRAGRQIRIELPTIAAVFPYGAVGAAQSGYGPILLSFPDHHILQDIPFLL